VATAIDVAKYILEKHGPMTAMKLQKLVYYCQAWSLVWDDAPLFDEPIQAWLNGPVVRSLYDKHKGKFDVAKETFQDGDTSHLTLVQIETIEAVLGFYGGASAQWLSDLSHKERPWRQAREGVGEMDNSENEITPESMGEYYTRVAELKNVSK